MQPIQESKSRKTNETAKAQVESPAPDIFQELRERKLKEPSLPKAILKEESGNKASPPSPHRVRWVRWAFAALIGVVLSVLVVHSLDSWDREKPEPPISTELVSEKRVVSEPVLEDQVAEPLPEKQVSVEPIKQLIAEPVLEKPLAPEPILEKPLATESLLEKHVATVIASLKTKHKARDWISSIPISRRGNPFSIDLFDAFVQDNSPPVLVRATLMDISYGSSNIEVVFALPNAQSGQQNLLILSCWKEQLDLFAEGVRGVSEYAVVADCYEVQNTIRGCNIIGGLIDAGTFSTAVKKQKIARAR